MKRFPLYRSKRNEYSLLQFSIRSKKDAYLFGDVENFMVKHNISSNQIVDLLLNHTFSHARYTDHNYPF